MRLCVVVAREPGQSLAYCGECQFVERGCCRLFDTVLTKMGEGSKDFGRVNKCFEAQRRGEDPSWRNDGIEP